MLFNISTRETLITVQNDPNDEIIRSRLRELLLHMTDSYPDELLSILNRIIAIGGQESLSDFWRVLSVRSEELAVFWRSQLNS